MRFRLIALAVVLTGCATSTAAPTVSPTPTPTESGLCATNETAIQVATSVFAMCYPTDFNVSFVKRQAEVTATVELADGVHEVAAEYRVWTPEDWQAQPDAADWEEIGKHADKRLYVRTTIDVTAELSASQIDVFAAYSTALRHPSRVFDATLIETTP